MPINSCACSENPKVRSVVAPDNIARLESNVRRGAIPSIIAGMLASVTQLKLGLMKSGLDLCMNCLDAPSLNQLVRHCRQSDFAFAVGYRCHIYRQEKLNFFVWHLKAIKQTVFSKAFIYAGFATASNFCVLFSVVMYGDKYLC